MASLSRKKFGSVMILTVFFSATVFWWMDKDFKSEGFAQDDLNEITEKLHGDLNSPVSSSNAMSQARKKSHSERQRSKSKSKSLSEAEMRKILNQGPFSSEDQGGISQVKLQNPLANAEINSDLDSLTLINALGVRPSLRFDSSNNILSIAGQFLLQSQNGTGDPINVGVISLLEAHKSLIGFGGNETASINSAILKNARGESIIRVDRMYKDLPVWGRQLVVTEKNGSVVLITGKFRGIANNIDVSALLNDSQLGDLVSSEFEKYGPSYASIKSAVRGIYIKSKIPIYAYKVIAEAAGGRQWELYYSPSTESLIAKVPLFYETSTPSTGIDLTGVRRSFNSYFQNNKYIVFDESFPQGAYSGVGDYSYSTEDGVPWAVSTSADSGWNSAAVSAISNSKQAYDYFYNTHDRNSFDGNGTQLISIVNVNKDGEPWYNATWSSDSIMRYGTGKDGSKNMAIALDVAGHEFSHGVVKFTANLRYQNQSGAMNESFADFFGAMIDRDDWYIGEDLLHPYGPYDYLRDMSNPPSTGSPGHMDNFLNLPNTEDGDHGGVHYNSGIPNRALYLLAEGLTNEGLGASVGKIKAERLAYATLQKLPADAEFIDYANTMILESQSVYGSSSAEYQSVTDAWDAVGVTTSVVVTEGGSEEISLTTGDDVLVHLYPRDGSMDNLWSEEYDIYVQLVNQPFSGHISSAEVGPINDVPAAGAQPSLHTDENGNLFAVYVGNDGKARWSYVSNTSEDTLVINNDSVNSVASSPSGNMFGVVFNESNKIWLWSFVKRAWETIEVVGPSYSADGEGGSVEAVDAINFDVTGQKIIFDFSICKVIPAQTDCTILWSIGVYDIGTETFEYPFSSSNLSIDIGFPRFSNTRNDVIAFDYQNWTDYDTDGKAVSRALIYDLSSRETIGAYDTNVGDTRTNSFGIPSFIGEDVALAIQAQGDTTTKIYQVSLDDSYNYIADSSQWLTPFESGFGKAHRNAYKNITATLDSDKPNADFGPSLSGPTLSTDFTISNSGNREISVTAISMTNSRMSTNLTNRTMLPGETATFSIKLDTNGAVLGQLSGTITIEHSGDNATLNLGLSAYIDLDTDEDGIFNSVDDDDDGDNVLDESDAFPLDASEWLDTDSDGIGNNTDTDDDGDGVADADDALPLDSSESSDYDGDGIGDNADTDDGVWTYENNGGKISITGCSSTCPSQLVMDNTVIGMPVVSIADHAFRELGLTSVSMPDGITSIGYAAFYDNSLTNIEIPESVSSIGGHAFKSNNLTKVILSSSLTSIEESTFSRNALVSISIPNSVTSIGDYAFYENTLLESVVLPNNLTSIGYAVFYDNALASIDIPSSVTSIGAYAFGGNKLTSISIPNSVTSIGDYAFSENTLLESVVLPNNLTSIGYAVFYDNALASIDIPSSVTSIGAYAFRGNKLTSISIPNNVTSIGDYAFSENTLLESVVLPNNLTSLGKSIFYDNALASIDIPSSVTSIGAYAFRGNKLTSISIPNNVTSIGDYAFADNELLSGASFLGDRPNLNTDPFVNDPLLATVTACTGKSGWPGDSISNGTSDLIPIFDCDSDGVTDDSDAFPLDATETIDTDSDGTGNNADTDDDGDGVADVLDAFPLNSTETIDTDSDGTGNNADTDDDGDGVGDSADVYPLNSLYSKDSDSDGMPDAWETRYGLNSIDASDATSDQDNDGVSALDEFLAGTIPAGSLDIDGNGQYDALTDGLLLLRGMFLLSGDSLISDAVASDAVYKTSGEVASRIDMLGDLVDIDGNGTVDALTDGLVILRYLFNLRGDVLINDVIASDAMVKTAEDVEAKIEALIPVM